MINDKKSGLLYGTFCADALSLGVHWIYDTQELEEKHGRITHYKTPGPESYHPRKLAGDQGHVGDQSLCRLIISKKRNDGTLLVLWMTGWGCGPTTTIM